MIAIDMRPKISEKRILLILFPLNIPEWVFILLLADAEPTSYRFEV